MKPTQDQVIFLIHHFLDGLKCPDESIIKTIEYLEKKIGVKNKL